MWRFDAAPEVVAAGPGAPTARRVDVPMPAAEGAYVVAVRASWESAPGREPSRLARLLRRPRRAPHAGAADRTARLAVVDPATTTAPAVGDAARVVDVVDLGRHRDGRPVASGRAPAEPGGSPRWPLPAAAVAAPGLRDRLRDWIGRDDAAALGPPAGDGLAWSAAELRVEHPGRPHRLRLTLDGAPPEALGVALVVPGAPPRVLLDACWAGAEATPAAESEGEGGAEPGAAPVPAIASWPVWPDAARPVVVLVNRAGVAAPRIRAIELEELPALAPAELAPPPDPAGARRVALDLAGPGALDRFGDAADPVARARRLAAYARHCGATAVVLPDALADRDARRALEGQADPDALGPDPLALTLRLLAAEGLEALLEVDPTGPLPGLPAPGTPEASARHLVRLDEAGRPDRADGGPAYQVLHPEVAAALARRLADAAEGAAGAGNLRGVVVRLGVGPTLPGGPAAGLDDRTFAAFVAASFPVGEQGPVPGRDEADPGRYEERARFVAGAGRAAWLAWRADRLAESYAAMARAVAEAAPGARLAVVTPGLDAGPAGVAARRAAAAGQPPEEAWRDVGLDLARWPAGPEAPLVLRGDAPAGPDALGRELARSPELDAAVAGCAARGAWLGAARVGVATAPTPALAAPPSGGDEPLGHALAALDPVWVVVAGERVAGQEGRLARFAAVLRALPAPPAGAPAPRLASGVALRRYEASGRTYVALANDTPYEIVQGGVLVAAPGTAVDDLGGGRRLRPAERADGTQELVVALPPFGVAALRVAAPAVAVEPGASVLPDPAAARIDAEARDLIARLDQPEAPAAPAAPPLPGFEPAHAGGTPAAAIPAAPAAPAGWAAAGDPSNAVALDGDRPRGGAAALRLDAHARPAAAASAPFPAPGGVLLVGCWLRADRPGTVRLWVEADGGGGAGAAAAVRHADLAVGTDWAERPVRVPDLPPGPSRLRLRFEWRGPTPGRLWVDDVTVASQGPSEPDRRARRALLEAVQAYRARRYADFARLLAAVRGTPDPTVQTGRAGAADSGLPDGRRLR